jgi:cell division protein FtsW (lipid II flippase)
LPDRALSNDQKQARLLLLAAAFLGLYTGALSLAPVVRTGSWQESLRWDHWIAWALWAALFYFAHRQSIHWLPGRDPYLLPVAALLSGWGLLMIWRLFPNFGVRQLIWLSLSIFLLILGLRLPSDLKFLRRYRYLWLTSGLLLTGLTLVIGTNPLGYGPRMWLGCCGIYLQPSEPLKLLLVVYLAAYLAERLPVLAPGIDGLAEQPLLPLLAPTMMMTGVALALLLVQRDLGTASIFIFLYTTIVYVTCGRKRILLSGAIILLLAGIAGTLLFEVVHLRIDAWLNPWLDPSGRSYQIVQSLLAVANGGLFGRGPGLGNPNLVPIPHSDFIFAAISEETGLVGGLGLLALVALLAERGLWNSLKAPDAFRRYLAAGLTTYLAAQSILIIGGNLRLLPLTGVTLPFVSYGGSSLVTSFLSLLLLLHISAQSPSQPIPEKEMRPYLQLGAFLFSGVAAAALVSGWWSIYRAPALLARTDNPRRAIADRFVRRGSILDRRNMPISETAGSTGDLSRRILAPDLSAVVGYTDPVYGQTGLEASMDDTLRGLQGNPGLTVWWNHLLYGQPPAGLDIRTSLDLKLQALADDQMGSHTGALILINAETGEILAMASHPTFDANQLEQNWEKLVKDPRAPLLNRAAMGLYPSGASLGPILMAAVTAEGEPPALPGNLSFQWEGKNLDCAIAPTEQSWKAALTGGCPGAAADLGEALGKDRLLHLLQALGFYNTPQLHIPAASAERPAGLTDPASAVLGLSPTSESDIPSNQALSVSPLQMAYAAAALSAHGVRPPAYLVTGVNSPESGWVILPAIDSAVEVIMPAAANVTARLLTPEGQDTWQTTATAPNGPGKTITWFLSGTQPDWEGTPLALTVLIEEDNPRLAETIGAAMLQAAMQP